MSPKSLPRQQAAGNSDVVKVGAWVKPSEGGEIAPANDLSKPPATAAAADAANVNQQAAALAQALSTLIPGFQGGLAGGAPAGASNGTPTVDPLEAEKTNYFLDTAFKQAAIALGDLSRGVEYENQLSTRGEVAFIDNPAQSGLYDRLKLPSPKGNIDPTGTAGSGNQMA